MRNEVELTVKLYVSCNIFIALLCRNKQQHGNSNEEYTYRLTLIRDWQMTKDKDDRYRTGKVTKKDTGTEWYKRKRKGGGEEAQIRENYRKSQEAEEFIGLKFEFAWREACKLVFSNLYKTNMF